MDAGDKFTAIFWIVVLAIAGCYAYDDETSSSSDNYEYEEVEVDTVVVDEVVEYDAPVATSESSDIDASRDYRYRGSFKELDGRICVVQYFLSEPDNLWTQSERDVVTERVFEAEGWLKKQAAKFGNDVEFSTCSFGSGDKCYTLDYIPTDSKDDDNDDNLFQKAMRGIKWDDHDAFIERMKEKYDCESVLVLLMVKGTGRSWAYPYSRNHANKGKTQRALEGAVIFKDKRYKDGTVAPLKATTVAHEILHLCGAWDLYYEEGIQDHEHADNDNRQAEELFPNSTMIHDSKDIYSKEIDEVTAWLVGLKRKKDWYAWFQPEVIISLLGYRLYRCDGTADLRGWIYHITPMVPLGFVVKMIIL